MTIKRYKPWRAWHSSGLEFVTMIEDEGGDYISRHDHASDKAEAIAAKDAEIQTLRARVAELERAQTWRPIEEAPRDGTTIVMRNRMHSDEPFVALYGPPREYFEANGIGYEFSDEFLDTPKWGTREEGEVFNQFFEGDDLAPDCTFIRLPEPPK